MASRSKPFYGTASIKPCFITQKSFYCTAANSAERKLTPITEAYANSP